VVSSEHKKFSHALQLRTLYSRPEALIPDQSAPPERFPRRSFHHCVDSIPAPLRRTPHDHVEMSVENFPVLGKFSGFPENMRVYDDFPIAN
jgi:hypothetical protein